MSAMTQEDVAERQFGSHAAAYVSSAVHASGDDLKALGDLVRARPGRVLDLGCGGGHVAYAAAAAGGDVVAYDLSPRMLAEVRREAELRGLRVATRQGPAERLDFPDGHFNHVQSRFSAHHWTDLAAGLREAARVLAPGGTAAFVDIVSPGVPVLDTYLQAAEVMRDPSHVRDRSLHEWLDLLQSAGFGGFQVSMTRLRMEFASWTARIGTPPVLQEAILALQAAMSDRVRSHFEIDRDGSFTIDSASIVCWPLHK